MDLQAVAFYVLALVSIAAAFLVISARNPVHSVLCLILTFFRNRGGIAIDDASVMKG